MAGYIPGSLFVWLCAATAVEEARGRPVLERSEFWRRRVERDVHSQNQSRKEDVVHHRQEPSFFESNLETNLIHQASQLQHSLGRFNAHFVRVCVFGVRYALEVIWSMQSAEPSVDGEIDAHTLPGNGWSMLAYLPALLNADRVCFEVNGVVYT